MDKCLMKLVAHYFKADYRHSRLLSCHVTLAGIIIFLPIVA